MKMEGLSKGMLETMAEHGLLSLPFDSTTAAADRGSERRRLFGKEVGAAAGRSFSLLRVRFKILMLLCLSENFLFDMDVLVETIGEDESRWNRGRGCRFRR